MNQRRQTVSTFFDTILQLLAAPLSFTLLLCLCALPAGGDTCQPRGLPFIRTYPLDEIGNVPRGLRLGFDAVGRIAVMYDGIYSVLNDSTWVDRIDPASTSKVRITTIKFSAGIYYYGGRGSWGTVEISAKGLFRASPLVPADAPAWTSDTPFNNLLPMAAGMYFYELNGVVCWDFSRRKNFYYPMPRLTAAFPVGDRVFVACQDQRLRELQPGTNESRILSETGMEGHIVEFAAPLDATRTILATRDGGLFCFDGNKASPWHPQTPDFPEGRVTAMEQLVDGGVAIAVADKGLYLFSVDGTLRWSLPIPELKRIRTMSAGEAGVIWTAGENAVHRIFYDSPITGFGQQLGLVAAWPRVAAWNDKIVVCSNCTLYEMQPAKPGHPSTLEPLGGCAARRADFMATSGTHLLAGNLTEVFSVGLNGEATTLIHIENVSGLVFIQPDTCIAIGSKEIAALKYVDGSWIECAPRIKGVGDSPIHTQMHKALWIERGGDKVSRLDLRNGMIDLKQIEVPWSGAQWTNVGEIGHTIIFSGAVGHRAYYDELTDSFCEAPAIEKLLSRSPYWISRVTEDASGIIWATHTQGIVTFTPENKDYVVDSATFELRNDSYPSITLLPGNNTWISAGRSFYHVERGSAGKHTPPHAVLVSLVADQQNLELLHGTSLPELPPKFSFDDNSLSFRFFSGTYAWRSPPLYEYRLGNAEAWTPVDPSLVLRFPKLRDGAYELEVRLAGPLTTRTRPFRFSFIIPPPWYRTQVSYASYALALLASLVGSAFWINHRSLKRNTFLEREVHERTKKLEITMERLSEETRNAATLAERSRLAGEIHDSLQQGLSGAILLLDTTMADPVVPAGVYSNLHVMRSMLSYSREEVQHAVWNLESPLLQNSTLVDALKKLVGYINSGSIKINVQTQAEPAALEPMIQHNLLRIAQEAITNAVKHSEAVQIDVTLRSQPDSLMLSVSDNGKGFNPEACSESDGRFGLRGLRARAKAIRANLQLISAPGAGTTVLVSIPIKQSHT